MVTGGGAVLNLCCEDCAEVSERRLLATATGRVGIEASGHDNKRFAVEVDCGGWQELRRLDVAMDRDAGRRASRPRRPANWAASRGLHLCIATAERLKARISSVLLSLTAEIVSDAMKQEI